MSEEITIHIATSEKDRVASRKENSWVDALIHFLKLSLLQFQGYEPNIEVHEKRLKLERIAQNEAVVLIVSPNFIMEEKLIGDLGYLSGKAESEFPQKKSFFKVVKVPVEQKKLPPELRELLAYNFFYLNRETGLIQEYEQFAMLDSSNAFWSTLVDLTYDILESVLPNQSRMIDVGKGRYVFLAETSYYLQMERRVVKRELSRYGYQVLPDTAPPTELEEIKQETLEALAKSEFSIHLIGEQRGEPLTEEDTTITELQLEIANDYAENQLEEDKGFNRLIWLPPNISPQDNRQELFVDELREHADATHGIEIVQVKLEDFKTMLLRQLALQMKQAASLKKKEQSPKDNKKQVYLVAEVKAADVVKPLVEWYEKQDAVVHWAGSNPLTSHREKHVEYLNISDSCIICYHNISSAWLVTKLQDILKSPGLGRKKPIGQNAVVTFSQKMHEQAAEILGRYPQYRNIALIQAADGFPAEKLKALLEDTVAEMK